MINVYEIDYSEWNSIVKSFNNYDVYLLKEYVKAFMLHGDGEPLLLYYCDSNTRGINVVMKRDISKAKNLVGKIEENKYYDFATPYGYGGWLIEGNGSTKLFEEYTNWCINNNIVTEFVRFHPISNNQNDVDSFYDITYLGNTVSIDLSDESKLWENFSSKNRNVIRKAIKNNVVIKNGLSKELLDEFKVIYNKTMDKDNATDYYYFGDDFYNSILEDLKDNATIFYAEYEGKIIAMSIIIYGNGRLNYHLSGSLREYQHLAPTNLLLCRVSEWGSSLGYTSFHLGGGVGCKEDSLFKFKRSFYKGELKEYYIGRKIFNIDLYNKLCDLVDNNNESNFFPLYRL